ncbi:YceI family protein [uncultured Croceitalea sp.]|uniref:YceI family protein n=1 Tax=uncultured Croceitalea sp. TaxID=1798908 RepID=UPI0033063720
MRTLKTNIVITLLLLHFGLSGQSKNQVISRQGQVSFFSYTSVENIEATNNQALSVIDKKNGEIAVQILLRAFVFKKALMEEHFNESYVESDIYPKLIFSGKLQDLDFSNLEDSPKFIKGEMDFHGVQKEIEIKTNVETDNENLILYGTFEVAIDDFNIKVPPLLVPNISKEIHVKFRFEYTPYEK